MIKYLQWVLVAILVLSVFATLSLGQEKPGLYTSPEISSPKDRISREQIKVYSNQVILDIENPMWASFADTNSMDPFIDAGANSIEIKPKTPQDIEIGDIISYHYRGDLIVHRVIDIGTDDQGLYFTVKGDNNSQPDPAKIRFDQVNGVLVAVIY